MDKGGRWRVAGAVLALAGAVALAGCGKKQDAPAVVGQVIAHVGPDDVTQPELDNEMRLANIPVDKRTDEVVKAVLSRVVERKYLVQQAMAAKLDREPTVHLDLLRSREQILGNAYVQRDLGGKITAISKNEIDTYIQSHPDQFDKRQAYNIEQVTFQPPKDIEQLSADTKNFQTMDQVEAKLNSLGIKFSRGPATLDSATMPEAMVKALQARKPEDIFFIRARTNASYFKVISAEDKPLTGEEAQQLGRRELAAKLAKTAGEDSMKAAVAESKFEGDYGRIMTMAPTTPAPAPASPPAAAEPAKPGEEPQKDAPKN